MRVCFISFVVVMRATAQESSGGASKEAATPSAAEGPEAAKYIKKDEWVEIQGKIGSLQAKIKLRQDAIKKLTHEKNNTKDPQKLEDISKSMVIEHNELRQAVKEYDQQRALLIYRFPEKGAREERKYHRIEVKPLNEMEKQITLDGQLKSTLHKVKKQFPSDKKNADVRVKNNDQRKTHEEDANNNHITTPIIFQK